MKIETYISELLFEHDCVIIPGFGGFVCNYSPSEIIPSKHQFHPPYKKISFNRNLRNNDGLLANKVAQGERISFSEASRQLSVYVECINKELERTERFEWRNIGVIYIGEEKKLLFEQDRTVNYLPESFGLTTFFSPAIKRESLQRKAEILLKDKVLIPSKLKKESTPIRKRTYTYILASAAVVVIALLIWIPFQAGLMKNIDYSSLNPFAGKELPHYQASETTLPKSDNEAEDMRKSLAADTNRYINIVIDGSIPIVVRLKDDAFSEGRSNPGISKKSITTAGNRFHIVGGAFAVPENADKFRNKLSKQGYDATIIEKKLRFVSYGSYSTREEALQALEKIRQVQGDAWLMKM